MMSAPAGAGFFLLRGGGTSLNQAVDFVTRRDSEVVDVELTIWGIPVRGIELDTYTGCTHYRSELDIIAVKFNCCRTYYSCFYCHELKAGHPVRIWPRAEFRREGSALRRLRDRPACGADR